MSYELEAHLAQHRALKDHIDRVHVNYHKLVAMAWDDPEFKARLLREPDAVFQEFGIPLPPGVGVTVSENTSTVWNFVLPAKLAEVAAESLEPAAEEGSCVCTCCCGYLNQLDSQLAERPI